MRKSLLFCVVLLIAIPSYATYIVVLKNGGQYKAKAKWTIQDGKARVALENGQVLMLDPALIDEKKSEATTKLGLGNAQMLDLSPDLPAAGGETDKKPSLGSTIKLRKLTPQPDAAPATTAAVAPVSASGPGLGTEVITKFARAYENVGLFEQKITSPGSGTLRAELVADSEDKVFNAISATSFLMVRNAGITGVNIDMVELFMQTTTGGAAGRFQMSRADAEAIDKKTISLQQYFVHKVIY